ncbi:MAG: hypothetical protein HY882_00195 [Deltaproteobacteria bacterium]|nr:hypothetical protein [Deltaproteobacteria bacterium]
MRKMFLVSCGLLFLLGTFACAKLGLAPPPLEPVKFSGSKDFTSEPFSINTKEWQINWEYKAEEKKVPNLVLHVYPGGDKVNWIEMVKTPRFDASGNTYLYQGKGRYYIKVTARNIANWQVEVVRAGVREPLKSPATFTGSADMTTKPFKIRGKEFKITYVMETPAYAGQSIAVYPRGETENYIDMSTVGAGTGTRVLKGPGEYYIKVQCTGVERWKIDVTE